LLDHPADEAAKRFCATHGCHRRATSTDWKFFLPVPEGGRVLEIGAGFGDDTLALARVAKEVVSLVPDEASKAILRRRLEQSSAGNVDAVLLQDLSKITQPDVSIDAISIEDVAAPAFRLTDETLPDVVHEWARILSPRGSVFVGVRNTYRKLPGARSWMPPGNRESLNRFVKRAASASSPKLSRGAVVSCMRAKGFDVETFAPIPHEQAIEAVVPLGAPESLRYCLNSFLRQNYLGTRTAVAAANVAADADRLANLLPYYFLLFRR